MMQAVRLAGWYWPHIEDASYYGYRWGIVAGPWLVMFGKAP
jgi:hypothetical protein